MLASLLHDDSGFIVTAELVLIVTLLVIGLIVGLSEVQHSVVAELNDVGDAIGSLNQSFVVSGLSSFGRFGGFGFGGIGHCLKGRTFGSAFIDFQDVCDLNQCALGCDGPVSEGGSAVGGAFIRGATHHGGSAVSSDICDTTVSPDCACDTGSIVVPDNAGPAIAP